MSSSAALEFRVELERAGLVPDEIIEDGELHRCGTIGKEHGKDGAYVFHPDEPASGWWQNYRTGESSTWTTKERRELSFGERERLKRRVEADKKRHQEESARHHTQAREKAKCILAASTPAPADHAYLVRKGVAPMGRLLIADDGRLVLPVLDAKGDLMSLQFIAQDGDKRFLPGGKLKGGYFPIPSATGAKDGPLFVCEGYATGATIHAATGAALLVAFNAGNLQAVAEMARAQYPNRQMIICADDDHATAGNPGLTKATGAALAAKALLAVPKFSEHAGKSDFNDMMQAEGLDAVKSCIATAESVDNDGHYHADADGSGGLRLEDWRSTKAFIGDPPKREYLVEGVFPKGQASLVAAAGGVGKSFLLLAMAADVARGAATSTTPPFHFGGALRQGGMAVYLSAEDDAIELHNRLNALGGPSERLIAVPFPSAGGAKTFFKMDQATRSPVATEEWETLTHQLKNINELELIAIDPLQVFCSLDLNAPENAQFVCSCISTLAAETGAAVIVSHHFRKTEVGTPEDARQAIRGSSGLVDGMRCIYALWLAPENGKTANCKAICKTLNTGYEIGKVVFGAVVKANGMASKRITTFLRQETGILEDVTFDMEIGEVSVTDLADALAGCIAEAAQQGRPYTKTGENGLYSRRHELGEKLSLVSKHRLASMAEALLAEKRIVLAMAKGIKSVKWLDVPGGAFARGEGAFAAGHMAGKI